MAIIPLPPEVRIRKIEWTLDQPAQVNRSEWTKGRQVVDQPGPSMWSATAELVVHVGSDAVLEAEAFIVDLEGQRHSFRLPLVEGPQTQVRCTPVVDGPGQGARTLKLRGGTPNVSLRRGHKMTVGEQPVMLMAPVIFGADGKATAIFKPTLRAAPADGAAVEVMEPAALVSLTVSQVGWSVEPGRLYQIKQLVLEEAF